VDLAVIEDRGSVAKDEVIVAFDGAVDEILSTTPGRQLAYLL
jgi:hypothetical protein